jgi:hypothetical protein
LGRVALNPESKVGKTMQHRRFLVAAIAACLLTTVATELQASPTVAGGAEAAAAAAGSADGGLLPPSNLKPQLRSRRWRPQTEKVAKKKLSKVPGEGWTKPVPLFVMMPLDTVDPVNNTVRCDAPSFGDFLHLLPWHSTWTMSSFHTILPA